MDIDNLKSILKSIQTEQDHISKEIDSLNYRKSYLGGQIELIETLIIQIEQESRLDITD